MWLVRAFLWSLVTSVGYQGYRTAGQNESYLGLTFSIMNEKVVGLFQAVKAIPRAFVLEAIKETHKHPNLLEIPLIQERLTKIQQTIDYLRKSELTWRLDFQDLITELHVTRPWGPAVRRLKDLRDSVSSVSCWLQTKTCRDAKQKARDLEVAIESAAEDPWLSLMEYKPVSAATFIKSQYLMSPNLSADLHGIYEAFKVLYNVTTNDPRISALSHRIDRLSWAFKGRDRARIIKTLLTGDLWDALITHTVAQDIRIHRMLDRSGIVEVQQIRERVYATATAGLTDLSDVDTWFNEAATWSWWLPDTIPAIVRRCMNHTTGDCTRIGTAEIDSLMNRPDVAKSIHAGLWSCVPLVGIIFIAELVIEYFKKAPVTTLSLVPVGNKFLH
jgi:hypothetical protein